VLYRTWCGSRHLAGVGPTKGVALVFKDRVRVSASRRQVFPAGETSTSSAEAG
jgi:hypothetical protein